MSVLASCWDASLRVATLTKLDDLPIFPILIGDSHG